MTQQHTAYRWRSLGAGINQRTTGQTSLEVFSRVKSCSLAAHMLFVRWIKSISWIFLIHDCIWMCIDRPGVKVPRKWSRTRTKNCSWNRNAISLTLAAVSIKRGTCARRRSGAIADVCARQPICFRMLSRARADAESARNQT